MKQTYFPNGFYWVFVICALLTGPERSISIATSACACLLYDIRELLRNKK